MHSTTCRYFTGQSAAIWCFEYMYFLIRQIFIPRQQPCAKLLRYEWQVKKQPLLDNLDALKCSCVNQVFECILWFWLSNYTTFHNALWHWISTKLQNERNTLVVAKVFCNRFNTLCRRRCVLEVLLPNFATQWSYEEVCPLFLLLLYVSYTNYTNNVCVRGGGWGQTHSYIG